jgi:endo-1,4-beta-xylanase
MKLIKHILCALPIAFLPILGNSQVPLPIAHGQDKFLGNIYSTSQATSFSLNWNQVTPENAGKWGSVESTRNSMNWGELDKAYKLAKDNGFPFRFHILVWGNQQPAWIENLPANEQLKEIREWFEAVSKRYKDIDYIEVVNEPLHDPPLKKNADDKGSGNYMNALGGSGTTGWDWIVNSFKLAREYFPGSKLMINEYNIIGSTSNTNKYLGIINLLKKDSLIDIIGFQGHAFSTTGAASTMKANLDLLAATGLPIQVTEMDIDGPTDLVHLQSYQRIFPVFWKHPSVMGITLWGWRSGMWRTEQKAYLLNLNASPRPAMIWLQNYVRGTWVPTQSLAIVADSSKKEINTFQGKLQLKAAFNPDTATLQNVVWSLNNSKIASIDQNGMLSALANGTVTVTATAQDGTNKSATYVVTVTNQNVGVDVLSNNNSTKVYPNPSSDGAFNIIDVQNFNQAEIFDLSGKKLKDFRFHEATSRFRFQLDFEPGVYLIRLSGKRPTTNQHIVIK